LSRPIYSSILTGKWDTLTGAGGDNIELDNAFKIDAGLLVVGFHKADTSNLAMGVPMPTTGLATWGNSSPLSEQAVLARFTTDSLKTNENIVITAVQNADFQGVVKLYPNPVQNDLTIEISEFVIGEIQIVDILGRVVGVQALDNAKISSISTSALKSNFYFLKVLDRDKNVLSVMKFLKL
jgi:Secretion system C-terminal sorting domain